MEKYDKDDNDDDDDEYDAFYEEQEMFLMPLFIEENSIETGSRFKCKLDNKVFNDIKLMEHFDQEHKAEFKKWVKKSKKDKIIS